MPSAAAPDHDRLPPFGTETFGVPPSAFTGIWSAMPPESRHGFVHEESGRAPATVQVDVLPLNDGDIGGISNAPTHPPTRRRGPSTGLRRESIAWLGPREVVEAVGDSRAVARLPLGATAWAGGAATVHGDLDLETPETRPGGMVRGAAMPSGAWFPALDPL